MSEIAIDASLTLQWFLEDEVDGGYSLAVLQRLAVVRNPLIDNIRKMRTILRMMRKSPLLDALMSGTKQRILVATLLQPDRSWYLLELSRQLNVRPSSLQRELNRLAQAGILKRKKNGNRVYFQADTTCPVFVELAQIVFKTAGVVDALRQALRPLHDEIAVAFIYGSIAASAERSGSDIDLMIIGSAALSRIASLLRNLEREVGRPINPTVYAVDDFARKVRRENHFLRNVLAQELLFIKGGRDELAEFTARATDKTPPDKQARVGGSARPDRT